MLYQVHLTWAGFKLTTLVVISTDRIAIGSCKSNYHTIMTGPYRQSNIYALSANIKFIYFICTSFRNSQRRASLCFEASTITVDFRYLEFDGTMEKIRVNRSLIQEELQKYRKCSLFNDERETTRAKLWSAKTSIACPYSRNDFKHIRCFCCCFFSLC